MGELGDENPGSVVVLLSVTRFFKQIHEMSSEQCAVQVWSSEKSGPEK